MNQSDVSHSSPIEVLKIAQVILDCSAILDSEAEGEEFPLVIGNYLIR